MKKTVKVIMLPTEKASQIYLDKGNIKYTGDKDISLGKTNQFLYFISDEEIKEGDWSYYVMSDGYFDISRADHKANTDVYKGCKKIVASTDKSLELPQIPQSFKETYVKANGKINEVQIEYEATWKGTTKMSKVNHQIKLSDDNCVIIHPARTYSKEEVKEMIIKCCESCDSEGGLRWDELKDWIEENL